MVAASARARLEQARVSAFAVPLDASAAAGKLAKPRTLVTVEVMCNGVSGLGYTYAEPAAAKLIEVELFGLILNQEVFAVTAAHARMAAAARNWCETGAAASAVSAVDAALWDLKAKLLDVPLCDLLGRIRDATPVYGSGGFDSQDVQSEQARLRGWASQGVSRVKIKLDGEPMADLERVARARRALGENVELFVDANGAYTRKEALAQAERFAELGVRWLEEPVAADDLRGLALLVERAPATLNIAAGGRGHDLPYFERMISAGAVDVLQADATRCGGVTGFMKLAALCDTMCMPLSARCAPALHCHVACAVERLVHLEYFDEHVRIEEALFDGVARAKDGMLAPDRSRTGLGLELRRSEAERFLIGSALKRTD